MLLFTHAVCQTVPDSSYRPSTYCRIACEHAHKGLRTRGRRNIDVCTVSKKIRNSRIRAMYWLNADSTAPPNVVCSFCQNPNSTTEMAREDWKKAYLHGSLPVTCSQRVLHGSHACTDCMLDQLYR